mgnify:FL=1
MLTLWNISYPRAEKPHSELSNEIQPVQSWIHESLFLRRKLNYCRKALSSSRVMLKIHQPTMHDSHYPPSPSTVQDIRIEPTTSTTYLGIL